MTVAEAFALAGHPVPEGARITRYDANGLWMWTTSKKACSFCVPHSESPKSWHKPYPLWEHLPSLSCPNLANLPAVDAWGQLPDAIRNHPDVAAKLQEVAP